MHINETRYKTGRVSTRDFTVLGTPWGHPRGNSSISTSILHQPQRYTDLALWRVINFCKESLSLFSLCMFGRQKVRNLKKNISECNKNGQVLRNWQEIKVICNAAALRIHDQKTFCHNVDIPKEYISNFIYFFQAGYSVSSHFIIWIFKIASLQK